MSEQQRFQATELSKALVDLPRLQKRVILVLSDLVLLAVVMFAVVWLRRFSFEETTFNGRLLMAAAPVITVATFAMSGLYRLVTRYIGYRGTTKIAGGVALSTLIWALLVFMSGQEGVPRSAIMMYALFGTLAILVSRHVSAWLLKSAGVPLPYLPEETPVKRVLIYGAGQAGVQLLGAIAGVADRKVVGFVDPQPSMWGQYVGGVKVYRPEKIVSLVEKRSVNEVLLALPSGQRSERRRVIEVLKGQPVLVKVLPALEDIASGRISFSDLRAIDVDDLLGRDPVPPLGDLLERNIKDKAILVTGAGGSIGSELVRQILRQKPKRLVLFENSEIALFNIERQAREIIEGLYRGRPAPVIVTVLGTVLDAALITQTLRDNKIETVFHAAAYKHVPIVEANPITGLENNVFGTGVLAACAEACQVERVVLISTDKAVRPTNVMGASKRLSELILQARASEPSCRTVFTMVRFGNVLDSSGSVVGLFRSQIRAGGPVTVTHPDVTRYFMSIPEAAALVIQAGAMATGGEVFVLEMGEPVKIDDLAKLMIRLTGLEVRTDERPDGDIGIVYSGLRPGEKLYEELLIGANTQSTEHPRIMRSDEPHLSTVDLKCELDVLHAAMGMRDVAAIQAVLMRTVEGYRPDPLLLEVAHSTVTAAAPSRTLH
ncbi:MAG: nucleoside-diphosphate sugar epimerase/dehydratase [Hyphomicrobiaceae bacterium]